MSLLFMDGFDHSGTSSATIHLLKWGTTSSPSTSLTAAAARTGPAAAGFGTLGLFLLTKFLPATGAAIVGCARRFDGSFGASADILQVLEGGTVHMALAVTAGGLLIVKRGTTVLATGTTPLALASYYYIEFKCVIHDTTGSYEVRIDGVTEAALTASGVDTRNGGTTGQWDRVAFMSPVTAANFLDDVYICDGSGPAPHNDFLGVCRVETLLPQVGNGSSVGLTPSTGTDHGALVDENPPNQTDYNSSATVGAKDTYHYPALALTGSVLGVQTNLYVQKSDAAARQVCAVVRAGGVDYDGANIAPLTTFSYFSEPRALNPNTGVAWTPADIGALEAGMKVTV